MRRRRFRIYMKYYPGGDLDHALGWLDDMLPYQSRPDKVTERFIWDLFRTLISAAKALQTGLHNPGTAAAANLRPITHLDINFRNIFLEQPLSAFNPVCAWLIEIAGKFNTVLRYHA